VLKKLCGVDRPNGGGCVGLKLRSVEGRLCGVETSRLCGSRFFGVEDLMLWILNGPVLCGVEGPNLSGKFCGVEGPKVSGVEGPNCWGVDGPSLCGSKRTGAEDGPNGAGEVNVI
jgi:hypothetical protein